MTGDNLTRSVDSGKKDGGSALLSLIRPYVFPPDLGSEERSRIAARLHSILMAFLLMLGAFTAAYLILDVQQLDVSLWIVAGAAAVFAIALYFLHRGYLRLAGGILMVFLFAATTVTAISFDGIHDTSLVAYFLLIAVSGLLMGSGAALFTALASALALAGVYWFDVLSGGVQGPTQPAYLKVIEMGGLLLVAGVVLRMTIEDLHWALRRSQKEVKERQAAEGALARTLDELEERVAARTADLSRAKRELEILIESSQDGILFISEDLRVSVMNSRALSLLELEGEPEDWLGRPVESILAALVDRAPELVDLARRQIVQQEKNGPESAEREFRVGRRILHWYQVPAHVEEKSATLIALHDVTSERQVEQMRRDLVQTMVHDLRNPLQSMLSTLDLLRLLDRHQRETLGKRQRHYVKRISGSVRQMTRLVNYILDVSRLESGQMPLKPEPVSLQNAVSETVGAQQALAQKKQLSLSAQVTPGLPPAWADEEVLGRVLQNLVDNAIKYTPQGGAVRVVAGRAAKNGSPQPHLQITVSDTGPGIPDEVEPILFQKYASGKHKDAGSGLGLAFCKLAIEAHGGHLWLEEQEGRGSTFSFTVPAAQEPAKETGDAATNPVAPGTE